MAMIDRDRGWNKLKRTLGELRRDPHTLVGVQGSEAGASHAGGGGTVADVATTHEFGAKVGDVSIPERSFIRAAIDDHEADLQKVASALGRGVIEGKMATRAALATLGEHTTGVMKQRIADGIEPENAPSTIARKGSSKPLIDSGQMRNSITHKEVA